MAAAKSKRPGYRWCSCHLAKGWPHPSHHTVPQPAELGPPCRAPAPHSSPRHCRTGLRFCSYIPHNTRRPGLRRSVLSQQHLEYSESQLLPRIDTSLWQCKSSHIPLKRYQLSNLASLAPANLGPSVFMGQTELHLPMGFLTPPHSPGYPSRLWLVSTYRLLIYSLTHRFPYLPHKYL